MFDLKTKILVVDDMPTMRKIIGKILKEMGYTDITEAEDGVEAMAKVKESPTGFGLIISDWNMPLMTGLEFLKKVRADQSLAATPFILVTAEAEQHQVIEAVKSGVDQYVVKPFKPDYLKAKMEMTYKKVMAKKAA